MAHPPWGEYPIVRTAFGPYRDDSIEIISLDYTGWGTGPAAAPSRSAGLQIATDRIHEYMNKETQAIRNDLGTLAEDARALMTATADVAGEKVGEARKRLAAALDSARDIAGRVRDKAVQGAKAADQAVREHPYQAVGIALGVGALIGFLVARRCSRDGD